MIALFNTFTRSNLKFPLSRCYFLIYTLNNKILELKCFHKLLTFRLHGSYEALKYGSVLDGLADLTGGVAESILLRSDPTGSGRLLLELLDMTSVVTANVQVSL